MAFLEHKSKSIRYKLKQLRLRIYVVYFRYSILGVGLNKKKTADRMLIVSLTSYPARYKTLDICIKSLLKQSLKPDMIILYLHEKDAVDIPPRLRKLLKYGFQIVTVPVDLKPHNKYFYAMKEFRDEIVITVDDDGIYSKHLVKRLYESYKKHPTAVSGMRVHRMKKNGDGLLYPYSQWEFEYAGATVPKSALFATGVGGVLYPPGCMSEELFNEGNIQKLCLKADDVWLKFMQVLAGTKVVSVPSEHPHPLTINTTQNTNLYKDNVLLGANDKYIRAMEQEYKMQLADFVD